MTKKIILSFLFGVFALFEANQLEAALTWNKTYSQGKAFGIYTMGDFLFASTEQGLLRSTDHGATWQFKGNGIGPYAVTYMYKRGNTIFAGVYDRGIMKSDNNGDSWQMSSAGVDVKYITGITGNTKYMFASAIGFCQPDTGSVYRSSDEGATWTKINKGIYSCAQRLLYGIVATDDFAQVSTEIGPFRSEDDGETWEELNVGRPSDCKTAYYYNGTTYVSDTQGLYKSTDMAKTWTESFSSALEFMAFSGDTMYACGNSGVKIMMSTDAGLNWSHLGSLETWLIRGIAESGGNLIIGTEHEDTYGIYVAKLPWSNSSASEKAASENEIRANYSPSVDEIIFEFPTELRDITLSLYNRDGSQMIRKALASSVQASLDASSLPSGVYFVTINSGETTYFAKVAIIK